MSIRVTVIVEENADSLESPRKLLMSVPFSDENDINKMIEEGQEFIQQLKDFYKPCR